MAANAGCARKAGATDGRIGFLVAVAAVGTEEQDRRAREIEVVHRVAVGHADRGERFDDALAAARNVVQMDQSDPECRADSADELGPCLVGRGGADRTRAPRRRSRCSSTCQRSPMAIARKWRHSVRDASIRARAWCSVPPPCPWMTCRTPRTGPSRRAGQDASPRSPPAGAEVASADDGIAAAGRVLVTPAVLEPDEAHFPRRRR